ncbi:hypothetical protein, partial [Roseimaritima sediminicola]|uniref:hypothetical protein n=1 Tax=Roseimaritima sediminicola TaxID=2662066 RepID=UPI001386797E
TKMGIGLTFEEFVNVKLRLNNEDVPKHRSADVRAEQLFPMKPAEVVKHLRARGYACRVESLEMLVRTGGVEPADFDVWTRADVDEAAKRFEECESFTPYATMCQALGCRYVDFLMPLRDASERESSRYGQHIPADDQYFVLHRTPPRAEIGDDGSIGAISPAVISFTLCDDVREQLEAGEVV